MLPRLWKQLSSIWGWGEREKGNLEDIAVRLIAGASVPSSVLPTSAADVKR